MEYLKIEVEGQGRSIRPGEQVEGRLEWSLENPPERLEVRLLWFTEGRGTRDVGVVGRQSFEHQPETGNQAFSIRAPEAPYSFEGRLITLRWILEAAVDPGDMVTQEQLVLGPGGTAIDLYRSE